MSIGRLAWVLFLLLGGCGNPEPAEILDSLEAPDGSFVIRFPSPPWDVVQAEREPFVLRIVSNRAAAGSLDAAFIPKYQVDITIESGDPAARARRDVRDARARGETIVADAREVTTASGATGFEMISSTSTPETRSFRNVYLIHPRGLLRLAFQATPSLDSPEVDTMIQLVEIREP